MRDDSLHFVGHMSYGCFISVFIGWVFMSFLFFNFVSVLSLSFLGWVMGVLRVSGIVNSSFVYLHGQ